MSHPDADRLALLALGEDMDAEERAHITACRACTDDLAALSAAVLVGRATLDVGELESPPESVWTRIRAEISAVPDASAPPPDAPVAPAAPARRQSRSRMLFTLAASVAVLLVLVGVGLIVRPAAPVVLAAASLDAFPAHPGAHGDAEVEEVDGARVLSVSVSGETAGDERREVWLITADATDLVSLGTLVGDRGDFRVPDDVDLDRFVLVDVSVEPDDGDPGHSGDSIVRGELRRA